MGLKRTPRNDRVQNASPEGLISDTFRKGNLLHIAVEKSLLLYDRDWVDIQFTVG